MTPLPAQAMKQILARRAALVEQFLGAYPAKLRGAPDRLAAAMRYSLSAGGKRLRPALCLSAASLCGLSEQSTLPFAAAIEMIHTYSLIHDDLPAMDDDDLRRGKPSCHKQFDEATAILAGDGLLTDAFAIASDAPVEATSLLKAMRELALAAGSSGMAGGQMLDMQYTAATDVDLDQVARMQAMKTGALLRASCVCGALLADADVELVQRLDAYGASLGRAYQIADDILDLVGDETKLGKPIGSDAKSGKSTWPALTGIEASRKKARKEAEKAKAALPDHPESAFLAALADYAVGRST